jgi:hypothetical protein
VEAQIVGAFFVGLLCGLPLGFLFLMCQTRWSPRGRKVTAGEVRFCFVFFGAGPAMLAAWTAYAVITGKHHPPETAFSVGLLLSAVVLHFPIMRLVRKDEP